MKQFDAPKGQKKFSKLLLKDLLMNSRVMAVMMTALI
jgi:hypothetical protein